MSSSGNNQKIPDFPSAQNMRDYINTFADHFNLREPIELNRKVTYVRPVEDIAVLRLMRYRICRF